MNLKDLYYSIKKIIDDVDFSLLWKGFEPLRFALYNENECFFDGNYIQKTEEFYANTSILFNNEYIAIWQVQEEVDLDILASKIIHEMFHAFQNKNNDSRGAREIEALIKYEYSTMNLSVKLEENKLLANLIKSFNSEDYARFLALRKYRLNNFEYEYRYESAEEQIEGSAAYVELNSLKQISEEKYCKAIEKMMNQICNPEKYLPIRIISYTNGALIFELLKRNNLFFFEDFTADPVSISILKDVQIYDNEVPSSKVIEEIVEKYYAEIDKLVQKTISQEQCVAEGEFDLLGINVYDARYHDSYIITTYFVAYMNNGKESMLYGDFVIQLSSENKVTKIFKLVK